MKLKKCLFDLKLVNNETEKARWMFFHMTSYMVYDNEYIVKKRLYIFTKDGKTRKHCVQRLQKLL